MFGWAVSLFAAAPNFRGKQRIFQGLFGFLPFGAARSRYGVRMVPNLSDSTYRACMLGVYGDFIEKIVARRTEPFGFLDIGANQGLYSVIAAANPHCRKAIAFEPNPLTFAFLVRNIDANGMGERILPVCAAIAPNHGEMLRFSVPLAHSGAASLFGEGGRSFRAVAIGEKALAQLFDEAGEVPLIAKIDVEGAEVLVLETLEAARLLDRIEAMVVEVSENIRGAGHSGGLVDWLATRGWEQVERSGGETHFDALYRRAASPAAAGITGS